jgi:LPXTG-site transpeptidase (sortase) family protein
VIQVWQGKHTYHYVVSSVQVMAPNDVSVVSVLNAPRVRPTLALISCTPYGVDTHRVAVIAQMR